MVNKGSGSSQHHALLASGDLPEELFVFDGKQHIF